MLGNINGRIILYKIHIFEFYWKRYPFGNYNMLACDAIRIIPNDNTLFKYLKRILLYLPLIDNCFTYIITTLPFHFCHCKLFTCAPYLLLLFFLNNKIVNSYEQLRIYAKNIRVHWTMYGASSKSEEISK